MNRLSFFLILLFALIIAAPAAFAGDEEPVDQPDPALLTLDELAKTYGPMSPALTPDGRFCAYVLGRWGASEDFFSKIWMIDFEDENPQAWQFTQGETNDSSPLFSGDSTHMSFQRGGQLWLSPVLGGEPWKLLEMPGGVYSHKWDADGETIWFVAGPEPDPEEGKVFKVKDEHKKFANLWRIKAFDEDAEAEQVTDVDQFIQSWDVSPDGNFIAMSMQPGPMLDTGLDREIYSFDVSLIPEPVEEEQADTKEDAAEEDETADVEEEPKGVTREEMTKLTDDRNWEWGLMFTPDSREVIFTSTGGKVLDCSLGRIWSVPVTGGETRQYSPKDFQGSMMGLQGFSADGKKFYASVNLGVNIQLAELDLEAKTPMFETLTGEGMCWGWAVAKDQGRMVCTLENPNTAGEVLEISDGKADLLLSKHGEWFNDKRLPKREVVNWRSTDGLTIEGTIVYPPEGEGPWPTVLKIHGGPGWIWPAGFHFNVEDYSWYMAQQGYAVLMPNVRGSTGYGEEFLRGCVNDFCGMDYEDAMSGLDYLIERGIADEDRLGIMGWSYGGIFGSKALTKTRRFSAACLGGVGVNWISFYGTTDIPDFTEHRYLSGTPYDNTEAYWNFGAMATITDTDRDCPVLIMQGEKDVRTPYPQALEYYRALKKLGVEVELVTYTGQGHGLSTLDAQKDKVEREMAWFDKYLKGED